MIDAQKIDRSWSPSTLSRRQRMSTFDEITKEKQRLGEALARVDLSVESSPASSTNLRQPSVCSRAIARARRQGRRPQPKCRPRKRRRLVQRDYAGAGALPPQNQLAAAAARRASTIRFLP